MIESFLITSRETLEASLVVGIVLAYLSKTDNNSYKKSVYYGIGAGIGGSLVVAMLFGMLAGGFEGVAESLFEGITMLIGSVLLTTMIFWMMNQRQIAVEIEGKVQKHLLGNKPLFSHVGIFLLIFFAIIREGVETVIFLNAVNYANGINFVGGTLGILVAIGVGYLFFFSSKKVNLKKLFKVSSILLILFAAGLVAHGVHELEEAGVVSGIVAPVFDVNPAINADGSFPALHEKGMVGSFLSGLFGYNGNPSLLEVMVYFGYLAFIFIMYKFFFGVRSQKTAR